jgi:hypothetical protein
LPGGNEFLVVAAFQVFVDSFAKSVFFIPFCIFGYEHRPYASDKNLGYQVFLPIGSSIRTRVCVPENYLAAGGKRDILFHYLSSRALIRNWISPGG